MKKSIQAWAMSIFIGVIIPWIVFSIADKIHLNQNPEERTSQSDETTIKPHVSNDCSDRIPVQKKDGTVEYMGINTYLVGVVLGEMPVSFHEEALKAQAVVARTYTLKRFTNGQKHAMGAVCTESSCCQAYQSPTVFLENGGGEENLKKVITAVNSTSEEVLYYDGVLIEATYFSCSGGKTEDALAVWGSDIPYLQSVESPGEEGAAYYTDSMKYSLDEFARLLGIPGEVSSEKWIGEITYTDGGGVNEMYIAGTKYTGVELRKKLSLRSTAFSISVVGDTVYITTRGFGHRVGMSQYGADAMASSGSTYREILSHYYPGTTLASYSYD